MSAAISNPSCAPRSLLAPDRTRRSRKILIAVASIRQVAPVMGVPSERLAVA